MFTPIKSVLSNTHTFHLVSSWKFVPISTGTLALAVFATTTHLLHFVNSVTIVLIVLFQACFLTSIFIWFFAILLESALGYHTKAVLFGLKCGMLLFIVSEIMFFFAFFWAFFHFALSPTSSIGCTWPAIGTQELDTWALPLCNTLLLLSSGVTITIGHHSIFHGKVSVMTQKSILFVGLCLTIVFGIVFLSCQFFEYSYGVNFSWKDNLFGSIFFITTGFHGFHVTIGMLFLLYCLIRINSEKNKFSIFGHFGFEAASWYWHFVDVVWIFLFIVIYFWGSFCSL